MQSRHDPNGVHTEVSIHAPQQFRGRCPGMVVPDIRFEFQSTPPDNSGEFRGRRGLALTVDGLCLVSIHAPDNSGGDHAVGTQPLQAMQVSIHAPEIRGRQRDELFCSVQRDVSIHTPGYRGGEGNHFTQNGSLM